MVVYRGFAAWRHGRWWELVAVAGVAGGGFGGCGRVRRRSPHRLRGVGSFLAGGEEC